MYASSFLAADGTIHDRHLRAVYSTTFWSDTTAAASVKGKRIDALLANRWDECVYQL